VIKDTVIQEFQKRNAESDVMGLIRNLYPDIELSVPSKKKGKKK
jgi:hypothetical protein